MSATSLRKWLPVPRSLLGRMLLLTLLVVLLAQALSSLIWVSQLRASQVEGLLTSSRSLAQSMAASVSYFRSLPLGYRPLVLDQLRNMGGTRFFVSLNDNPLEMRVLPQTPRKRAVLEAVEATLREGEVALLLQLGGLGGHHLHDRASQLGEAEQHLPHLALPLELLGDLGHLKRQTVEPLGNGVIHVGDGHHTRSNASVCLPAIDMRAGRGSSLPGSRRFQYIHRKASFPR